MRNIKSWFLDLSRIGKTSVLASLVLGGLFVASATTPPSTPALEQQIKQPVITYKTETEVVNIPFGKVTRNDATVPEGQSRIETAGTNGEKTITHTITLTDGIETARDSKENITKEPTNESTVVGTYVAPKNVAPATKPTATSTYYKNCTAARAAGAAPVYAGQPGYGSHLDKDDDGVGCE